MNATSVAGPSSGSRLRAWRGIWHGPARARGRVGARSGPPRRSHSLCDTAGAEGWLGSWMTHPQRSLETLVGSFAQQVFSLAVSELGETQPRQSCWRQGGGPLAAPQFGAGWGTPLHLAQG